MYILRGHKLQFPKNVVFLSLKIFFLLANSVGPDEMLHYTAFHLGLYCFVKISVKRLVKELHVLCGTHYSGSEFVVANNLAK